MACIVEDVTSKTEELVGDEPKSDVKKVADDQSEQVAKMENDKPVSEPVSKPMKDENGLGKDQKPDVEPKKETPVEKPKEERVANEVEPKTGVSFPVKLDDGKLLKAFGCRKKTFLGLGIKIYSFGIYADNEKLKELMTTKIKKAPAKPTKEMYHVVIDSDVGMVVRMVIVYGSLTMSMVKKNFDEGLGGSIKKLNGGRKNDELASKVMATVPDNIKLNSGSLIEITKLPGYNLESKVKGEGVSTVESELLCRAYFNMYLGDEPLDKEAKEQFGMSLLSLF